MAEKKKEESFLVASWVSTLKFLEKVSLFYVVRRCIFKEEIKKEDESLEQIEQDNLVEIEKLTIRKKRIFVDTWLLLHTLLPLIFIFISYSENVNINIKYAFIIYGSLRIFEILIYQLNVMLVHPYESQNYTLISYRRMTIALIHNFFEIVFWFAGTYLTFKFISDMTPIDAIYSSFTHMVTYSLNIDKSKWPIIALVVLQSQALMGVFMTVISLARFVSLFPQPKSMNENEVETKETLHSAMQLQEIREELDAIKAILQNKKKEV